MSPRPLCFVLMPFGKKADGSGKLVDFDLVYQQVVAPAIADAELQPIREDEGGADGITHQPAFERMILSEYAVADLTTADANVFYELGLRHAVRANKTVLMFAEDSRLPFDRALLPGMSYRIAADGTPPDATAARNKLARCLNELKSANENLAVTTLYQMVGDYPDISHTKTDVFRERVRYSPGAKQDLSKARAEGADAVRQVEQKSGPLETLESGVIIDLLLSYRAVKAWADMIGLVARMPRPVAETVMVQEQLAFALNRAGEGGEAERVLKQLLERIGPSSETYALLGRLYKDRWEEALKRKDLVLAPGLLNQAIEAYRLGFEADWRDAYPGINAVTLMELRDPPDPERLHLLPVVSYAVHRRIATGKPDYWDHATVLELAILAKDDAAAATAASNALASIREVWEPETTLRNLRLIREARSARGESVPWAEEIEEALRSRTT